MNYKTLNKIILASLFAALIVICAVFIHIPIPGGNGYLNIGDAFCIAAGILLGPVYGAAASAIGGALSDLFLGYAIYIPATAIIKALIALAAYSVFNAIQRKGISLIVSATLSVIPSPLLYFIYEYFFMGYGPAAAVNIPFNYLQSAVSAVMAAGLITALSKAKLTEKIRGKKDD